MTARIPSLLDNLHRLTRVFILQQLRWIIIVLVADFRQELKPQNSHLLLCNALRLELWQFHEHEMKPLNDLVRVLLMNNLIMMNELRDVLLKNIIHKIQRIDRTQEREILASLKLININLRRIEENPGFEFVRPAHLHLNDELSPILGLAEHIYDTVLTDRCARHTLRRHVFDFRYLFAVRERQERIQETGDKIRVFAKHPLERQIRLRV